MLDETVKDNHCAAWLVQQAADGWIEFADNGVTLARTRRGTWWSAPLPLRKIFGHADTVMRV